MTKKMNDQNMNSVDAVDETLNDDLQNVISDYWKDNNAPGFTGFKTNKDDDIGEKVRTDTKEPEKEDETEAIEPVKKDRKQGKKAGKKEKKKGGIFRTIKIILLIIILLLLSAIGTFFFLLYQGNKASNATNDSDEEITALDEAVMENSGKTVTYKGVTYTLNEDLSSILFMGVDREEYNEDGEFGKGGQADTIFLATINHKTGETKMIPISRNTMVEIDEYNDDGTYWRQNQIQIALAYSYGDGKEESCKNVAKAVSRFMYGMPVNKFVTIDLKCIEALNDAIGGVEVNVLEDLTEKDPELEAGKTVTLKGQQAETYVRSRKVTIEKGRTDIDNNAARMERQKQYLSAFMKKAIAQTKEKPTLPVELYKDVSADMITDITTSEVVYYASLLTRNGLNNSILSIPGEVKRGEYTELYADKTALYEIILDTFYERD